MRAKSARKDHKALHRQAGTIGDHVVSVLPTHTHTHTHTHLAELNCPRSVCAWGQTSSTHSLTHSRWEASQWPHTHTHTHTHPLLLACLSSVVGTAPCLCVCVCVCVCGDCAAGGQIPASTSLYDWALPCLALPWPSFLKPCRSHAIIKVQCGNLNIMINNGIQVRLLQLFALVFKLPFACIGANGILEQKQP